MAREKPVLIWRDPLFYSGLMLSASMIMQDVSYALKDGFQWEDLGFIGRAIAMQVITTVALLSERRAIAMRDDLDEEEKRKLIMELYSNLEKQHSKIQK